ncbi:MAG: hypothetical protein JWL86_2676 [Rhizobium sp.]|nr:hypothetical protein [Rhizobium sp.]
MSLTLISPAFADGEKIPVKYARDGDNLFPPVKWTGRPKNTKSFVLIVEDPDAPRGTFRHCGIFNIPADWDGLPESVDTKTGRGPRFATNDFGDARYDGHRRRATARTTIISVLPRSTSHICRCLDRPAWNTYGKKQGNMLSPRRS